MLIAPVKSNDNETERVCFSVCVCVFTVNKWVNACVCVSSLGVRSMLRVNVLALAAG